MLSSFVLGLSIATIIGIVIVTIRLLLKKRLNELSERITTITPYKDIGKLAHIRITFEKIVQSV